MSPRLPWIVLCVVLGCTAPRATTTAPPAAQPQPEPAPAAAAPVVEEDPYLWLEEVQGEKALAWVRERNAVTQKELEGDPRFAPLKARLAAIYDSDAQLPMPRVMGERIYNFWKDAKHPRGLWRRTTLAAYRKTEPTWETVLDLDALDATEHRSWVWHGSTCLPPKYERCLLKLSPGGSDAEVIREFDTTTKAFVPGGFELAEAKTDVSWKTLDAIYVGTDFGPGSLTESGQARIAKEWTRGTPLSAARTVFEGEVSDLGVVAYRQFDHGQTYDWLSRAHSFFTEDLWLIEGGQLKKIDKPDDAILMVWNREALVQLRTDWVVNERIFKAGSLISESFENLKAGKREFTVLFEPTEHLSLESFDATKTSVLLTTLEDVKSAVTVATKGPAGWALAKLPLPSIGTVSTYSYDTDRSDDFWVLETGYTTPSTLSLGHVGKSQVEKLKSEPAFFSSEGLEVSQHFATSRDGTHVPYFQVSRKGLVLDGSTPTVLEGYGGFAISELPEYDGTSGAGWLERGGAYVVANIRGGNEYGPEWHHAAMTHNRQRAYDDFAAVAQDLVTRKVTSPNKLGIIGGSNGGLLMGVMLTQHPELFGAVVCQVPLLDMKRYPLLLSGALWVEEYGDPTNADDWAAISKYSPYQNVRAGVKYPRTLFTTSTKDDRVHPGHARKMMARMMELGADVLSFENLEGGHAGAADHAQRARMNAMAYTFFAKQLGLK